MTERERCNDVAQRWIDSDDLLGGELVDVIMAERAAARREALEEAAAAVEQCLTTGLLTPANVKDAARTIRRLVKEGE